MKGPSGPTSATSTVTGFIVSGNSPVRTSMTSRPKRVQASSIFMPNSGGSQGVAAIRRLAEAMSRIPAGRPASAPIGTGAS